MSEFEALNNEEAAELVRLARAGDEAAFSKLFEQYLPLIDTVCARYLSESPSEEEARSEIMAAFWDAVKTYDIHQRSVTFGLYARICIDNRMISAIRKWKKILPTLPLDSKELWELRADMDSDPAQFLIQQEQYLELRRRIDSLLSDMERKVWLLFIEGQTSAEIAETLGITKKDANNAIFRARKKLKQKIPPH